MNQQSFYKTLISVHHLNQIIDADNLLIFDCRFDLANTEIKRAEYLESHIPGAIYTHLDEQLSSPILAHTGRHPMPDISMLIKWLASCGFDGSQQVVVYDDNFGAMATRLWWLLKCLGYEAVALLNGGWQSWLAAGYQVTDELPQKAARDFSAKFDFQAEVTTDAVVRNLESAEFIIVDVRAQERFIGKNEPIDPVAGHIPGAVNIPLTDNLDDNGCYLRQEKLKTLYQPIIDRCGDKKPVFMCGSGVTACHSVLAMVEAGFEMPRVYTGSWSEWIRDKNRPVATGS